MRAVGVESEAELEFSALLDVCRPLLDRIAYLPRRQGDALNGALGLGPAEEVDRFAIGAALLNLLVTASAQAPVLVLVDDAQWLDRSSADALLFAARRLDGERVAVLFAAREADGPGFDAPGLETLALAGLDADATSKLLGAAPDVAAAVHVATAGNPLALLELRPSLTAEQLAGREPLADPLPAGTTMERAFAERAASLPAPARTALLVAAVSASPDLGPVVAALDRLGVPAAALEPGEDEGLIRIEPDRLAFRHPLVRSAVFHAASPSERRAAHRALAAALADTGREEERAWHLAAAAIGPDAQAADALAGAARRARSRSGYAGAASALERAARLTPDSELRRARLHEAAEAAWLGGRRAAGIALVEEALRGCEDPLLRSRMLHLRGHIERLAGDVRTGVDLLVEAAGLVEANDPAAAVTILTEAVHGAVNAGAAGKAVEAATRARELAPRDGSTEDFRAAFALGYALATIGRAPEAAPHLARALDLLDERPPAGADPADLIRGSIAAALLDRATYGLRVAERATELAREQGLYASLPRALAMAGWHARRLGRWNEAAELSTEALTLARETGETTVVTGLLTHLATIDAARGDELRTRAHVNEALELAGRRGVAAEWPERALALLDLTLGRFEDAARRLERLEAAGTTDGNADLVEAYVRLGDVESARAAFERSDALGSRASAADAGASAARSRGLLASDDGFEEHFREALALHEAAEDAFGSARTRLCLGERLRRAGRRIDARAELRGALEAFERLGAAPWAARARAELQASGATLRRRRAHAGDELTPQESQIAAHVAQGKTNKEVAAALFLSHKTVDFHLGRVYRKLNLRSRGELIRLFAAA